jgi:hypothetical protein
MNIKALVLTCIFASSITGCAWQDAETPYREVVRVPYHFQVSSFTDSRELEKAEIISSHSAYPFKKEQVAQELIHAMNNSLFAATPAFLDIEMKTYSTIRENKKYLVSMLLDISAKNDTNVTLADGSFGCIAEDKESFELGNILRSSITQDEITIADRDNKTWQKIIKRCLNDIAYEFNSQVGRN